MIPIPFITLEPASVWQATVWLFWIGFFLVLLPNLAMKQGSMKVELHTGLSILFGLVALWLFIKFPVNP